jgi:hypothetical protein
MKLDYTREKDIYTVVRAATAREVGQQPNPNRSAPPHNSLSSFAVNDQRDLQVPNRASSDIWGND